MMEAPPPVPVRVTVDGLTRTMTTRGADLSPEIYKNLDKDIAALVQWCLAVEDERPVLEALHTSVYELRNKATPSRYRDYPLAKFESDQEVRRIVQRYILDA